MRVEYSGCRRVVRRLRHPGTNAASIECAEHWVMMCSDILHNMCGRWGREFTLFSLMTFAIILQAIAATNRRGKVRHDCEVQSEVWPGYGLQ